jgi:hypothetical protein
LTELSSSLDRTPTGVTSSQDSTSIKDRLTSSDANGDNKLNVDELTALLAQLQSNTLTSGT